jgi:A/G-specific adenine glycosylase
MQNFAPRLIGWHEQHGRHGLPWQQTRDPYAVWLSEIMLQQTQVASVIPYFQRFLARFPDIPSLAAADPDEVLAHWSGLGYYARGRNLHRAAQLMVERHGGAFPRDFEAVQALPGIGRSTAAAIAAFAFGQKRAILDGNVKRVLTRCFGVEGFPGERKVEAALWELAESLLPEQGIETYTQALMDLGATVCTRSRPRCEACPFEDGCIAHREGRTAELPTPKPRKALPQREATMLLLLRQGEILLEKRPPTGIWGGLWCLPELAPGVDPSDHCLARFGAEVRLLDPLPPLDHTFTHFKLRISPQPVRVFDLAPRMNQPGSVWLTLDDALEAAIPAPVRTLLGRIRDRAGA